MTWLLKRTLWRLQSLPARREEELHKQHPLPSLPLKALSEMKERRERPREGGLKEEEE